MVWIALIATAIVGAVLNEIRIAPEASDDYEIELWERYRRERQGDVPVPVDDPVRRSDAA